MTTMPQDQHLADEVEDIGKWTIYIYQGITRNVIDCYYLDNYMETILVPPVFDPVDAFRRRIAWLEEEFSVEIEKIKRNA
jgi:hypothetical protein